MLALPGALDPNALSARPLSALVAQAEQAFANWRHFSFRLEQVRRFQRTNMPIPLLPIPPTGFELLQSEHRLKLLVGLCHECFGRTSNVLLVP